MYYDSALCSQRIILFKHYQSEYTLRKILLLSLEFYFPQYIYPPAFFLKEKKD